MYYTVFFLSILSLLFAPEFAQAGKTLERSCESGLTEFYPQSTRLKVIGTRPDVNGNVTYIRNSPPSPSAALFEIFHIEAMTRNFPRFSRAYGFESGEHHFAYPSVQALNANIQALKGTPEESFIRFYEVKIKSHKIKGEPVDAIDYARRWAHQEVPYTNTGTFHFHDLAAHWSFLTLPKEIVEASASNMRFLLLLMDNPVLKKNLNLQHFVDLTIKDLVGNLDYQTFELGNNLTLKFPRTQFATDTVGEIFEVLSTFYVRKAAEFLGLPTRLTNRHGLQFGSTPHEFYLGMLESNQQLELNPAQQKEIKRILKLFPQNRNIDYKKLGHQLSYRFDSYVLETIPEAQRSKSIHSK